MSYGGMFRRGDARDREPTEEERGSDRERWVAARERAMELADAAEETDRDRRARPAYAAIGAIVLVLAAGVAALVRSMTGLEPATLSDPWWVLAVGAGIALVAIGVVTAVRRGRFTLRSRDPLRTLAGWERRDIGIAIRQRIAPSDWRRPVVLQHARAIRDTSVGVLWVLPGMLLLFAAMVASVLAGQSTSRGEFFVLLPVIVPVIVVVLVREHRAARRYLREFGAG